MRFKERFLRTIFALIRWRQGLALVVLACAGVAAVCVLLIVGFIPPDGIWANDQGVKWLQAESLVRNGFRDFSLPYPGSSIDPDRQFSPLWVFAWANNGRYFGLYPYPEALLTAFLLPAFGSFGHYGLSLAGAIATMGLSGVAARRWSINWAWLVTAVLGSSTPLLFYALVPWEHALAASFTTAATLMMLKSVEGKSRPWALASGLAAGAAIWMRVETMWFSLALALGALVVTRQLRISLVIYALGVALVMTVFVVSNTLMFGAPLGPLYAFHQAASKTSGAVFTEGGNIARALLFGTGDRWAWPAIMMTMAFATAISGHRFRPWFLSALAVVVLLDVWASAPLDLRIGLVNTAPFVLLAFLAIPFRKEAGTLASLVGTTSLIYTAGVIAITLPDFGGAQWGPRFLLPLVPLLVLLGFGAAISWFRKGPRLDRLVILAALAMLLTASLWIQFRGLKILMGSTSNTSKINRTVAAHSTDVVVSDIWFGPQILAPVYFDRKVLFVNGANQLPPMAKLLSQNGVGAFTYLSGRPDIREGLALLPPQTQCRETEKLPLNLILVECQNLVP